MAIADDEAIVRTSVTIPKLDYGEIERIAKEKRVSVAWVVREAVAEYLVSKSLVNETNQKKKVKE